MEVVKPFNINRFVAKGEEIYQQRLKDKLEPTHYGQIVAIEVESGDYFLGESVIEAGLKARAKYPDKIFHFIKIGFPTVRIHR